MQDLTQSSGEPMLEDPALPSLVQVLDASCMSPRLASRLGGEGRLAISVLKHTPGKRCVLGYRFESGARAIGKVYRKDRARRHADLLHDLGAHLAGPTRVPRLLDCAEDLGLVLQEWVPGDPVPEFEALGASPELVERLGESLADLHAVDLPRLPEADFASHVRRTCHPGLEVLATDPAVAAGDLFAVQTALFEREAGLARTVRTCHGDFSPRQIFDDGCAIYVVDLDGLGRSHPALDVANFRVGLEVHLGATGLDLGGRFLSAYLRRAALPALQGLEVYEAFGYLRRAMIAWRKRPPGWEAHLAACVERGHDRLSIRRTR